MLDAILRRFVCQGRLTVRWPDGKRTSYAGPVGSGPSAGIALADARTVRRMVFNPMLAVGEAYMDGGLKPDGCGIYDALDVLVLNVMANAKGHPIARLRSALGVIRRRIDQYNPAHRARRNVAHHYDLNGRLYSLFLDRDRQYSCAYFRDKTDDLDTAQLNKKRHIAAKLLIRPGDRVLDIGSGWGGLALYMASECGADVTGLTLSAEQHEAAARRAAAAGLADRVRFYLRDYRQEFGTYDRIVSVGMFEHVGINHYGAFFAKLRSLLTMDGVALLHSIGRKDGPGATHPWIRKYIFPGGYVPALSEVVPIVERLGLWITDVEILRLHYAETLRAWRTRFERYRDRVRAIYDERFCRMWEMYLVGSEVGFRRQDLMVFQIQLAKAVDSVPLTRDYMLDWERAHIVASDRAA